MAVGESYYPACSSWISRASLREQKTGELHGALTEGVLLLWPVLPGFLFLQDCRAIQDFPALPVKQKYSFLHFPLVLNTVYIPLRHSSPYQKHNNRAAT